MNCKTKKDLKVLSYTPILCSLFFLIFTVQVFAGTELMEKMVESINRGILLKEYDKAFTNSLFVLRNYKDQELPIDVEDACKRAVASWLSYLENEKKWEEIIYTEQKLSYAPDSIKKLSKIPVDKAIEKLKTSSALPDWLKNNPVEHRLPQVESGINESASVSIPKESGVLTIEDKIQILEEQRKIFKEFLYNMKKMEKEQEKIRYSERELYEKKRLEIELAKIEADNELRKYIGEIVEDNKRNTNKIIIMVLIAASIFCICLTTVIIVLVLVNKNKRS